MWYTDDTKYVRSPLWVAASMGSSDISQLLLAEGADVNQSYHSQTPLFVAAEKGYTEAVQVLLEHEADRDV